jgi:RNA polymerase sigma-70 factor (ECF subfamily)
MMTGAHCLGPRTALFRGLRSPPTAGLMVGMEPDELTAPTEQTQWMLAVRDAADREAFGKLFDFYAPRVKSMAMRSGSPAAIAEEIVQDVMLRIWTSRSRFDPTRAQVSSWIYQIARNRRIDLARREAQPLPEDLVGYAVAEEASDTLALEQEVAHLRMALRALPPSQREMIEKAYLGELTHQEISKQTSLPLGTVKSRVRLAIDRLRHELRELRK